MEHLLDNKEAAAFLGISEDRLNELIDHKVVPAYMIAEKFLRFKESELEVIRAMLKDNADSGDERIFNQAFSEVTGIERFKEILRANDIYLAVIGGIILIVILMLVLK
jgi:hypothetical protein